MWIIYFEWKIIYVMPRSHIHGSPRRFYYGLNLTDDPGNANFRSPIRMHYIRTTSYDYGCNTESYGPIRIATNYGGLYPGLIRRPVRECVTWASSIQEYICTSLDLLSDYDIGCCFWLSHVRFQPFNHSNNSFHSDGQFNTYWYNIDTKCVQNCTCPFCIVRDWLAVKLFIKWCCPFPEDITYIYIYIYRNADISIKSFLASGDFCRPLTTFAKSLDPDHRPMDCWSWSGPKTFDIMIAHS